MWLLKCAPGQSTLCPEILQLHYLSCVSRLISAYNSLTDKHLAGYFSNTRIRRHLQRAGLVPETISWHYMISRCTSCSDTAAACRSPGADALCQTRSTDTG